MQVVIDFAALLLRATAYATVMTQAPSSSCANEPAPDSPAESAFLQCLAKLNDDSFCQMLLPQLKADRSAGSLAATCSQLRRLCHNSIERLDMSPLINNHAPSAAEQWTQGLQEHFPYCSSVALCVQQKRSYHAVTYLLPALARLPKLSSLEVRMEGPPLAELLPIAMLLLCLRTQLTSLQSLSLEVSQSWADADLALAELASMTQLTKLSVTMNNKVDNPCNKTDLMQLSKLRRLKHLIVDIPVSNAADHPVCCDLVAQLTALTTLDLAVGTAVGFQSIGNCSNLQKLMLTDYDGVKFELRAKDWQVVGQLTQLTWLTLWPVVQQTDGMACRSALQQLTALRCLCADTWAPEVQPGLQGLSYLTRLGGGWVSSDGSAEAVTCAQVQDLIFSFGHIPCSAFPGLLHISLYGFVPALVMAALSKHCSLLQTFNVGDPTSPTVDFGETTPERVAAVMSLSSLRHLTALSFCVMNDAEMLALSRVAAVLAKSYKLTKVSVVVPDTAQVSSPSLLNVAQLSGVNMLRLRLGPHLPEFDTLQAFVCALTVVPDVEVVVDTIHDVDELTGAFAEARSIGLELPLHYRVIVEDEFFFA